MCAWMVRRPFSSDSYWSMHSKNPSMSLPVGSSDRSWLTEHTQREEWIGGFKKDGPKNRLRDMDIHKIVDVFTRGCFIVKC